MAEESTAESQDPSMEEILQTIRGVISGEEGEGEDGAAENSGDGDEVLELTEEAAEEAPAEAPPVEEGGEDSVLDDIDNALDETTAEDEPAAETPAEEAPAEAEPAVEAAPQPAATTPAAQGELVSDPVASASTEALKELVDNIPKPQVDSPVTRGGTTLEDLVIEAIKPFLSDWLNENLPTIVKQLVSKEIKKLVPDGDE